jgi:hypothetical protein
MPSSGAGEFCLEHHPSRIPGVAKPRCAGSQGAPNDRLDADTSAHKLTASLAIGIRLPLIAGSATARQLRKPLSDSKKLTSFGGLRCHR